MATKPRPPIVKKLREFSRKWFKSGSPQREEIESMIREMEEYLWESDWLRRENRELERKLANVAEEVRDHV